MSGATDSEIIIKNQFEVLKRIDTYIGTTNTKCTIIMSYCAAATALILAILDKLDLAGASMQLMVAIGLFSVLALAFSLWCMVLAALIIFPITFSKPNTLSGESLIFYGDIASCKTSEEYSNKVLKKTNDEFLEDLNGQIYTLATIASGKFSRIQFATIILMIHFGCVTAVLIGTAIFHLC